MPYFINILNMKTNGINQNGNIDIGGNIQNSHTANSKFIGANLWLEKGPAPFHIAYGQQQL